MKRKLKLWVAILATISMTMVSCQDELHETSGEYTFKTSGAVSLNNSGKYETFVLDNEIGTLTILNKKDNNDGIIITINSSFGPVQTATGRIAGNMILVEPFYRTLELTELTPHILQSDLSKTSFSNVKVTGNGERYGDTIIFTWSYEGVSTDGKTTLTGSDIKTVATRK